MKRSKIFILLFTLTFPVILYLFLRSYGQNEFALPVFFENQRKVHCKDASVKESQQIVFGLEEQDSTVLEELYTAEYKVVHFPNVEDAEIQALKNELNRVLNTFKDLSINILSFKAIANERDSLTETSPFLPQERAITLLYPADTKSEFVNCIYAFPTEEWDGKHPSEETIPIDHTLVLLDEKNRIRGYYDGYETKEVDRLILEIRVLLSNK